ncbi:lipocalin family protein [Botryobacter ruber]|uniref:lipocalin family protein n=1 Tax=Botryobacter ruber TaxID=2171629 RepID=UPI000F64BDBA|nr:lipocalin family protein [Botryobacter ruber]
MKKILLNPFLFFILILISFTGCKDDEVEPSRRDMLTGGTWNGTAVYSQGTDITESAKNSGFDITKNTLRFDTNGNYTDTYDGSSDTGTWEFAENESKLLLDKNTSNEQLATISQLNANTLNVTFSSGLELRYTR